jgi:hypothetical protein
VHPLTALEHAWCFVRFACRSPVGECGPRQHTFTRACVATSHVEPSMQRASGDGAAAPGVATRAFALQCLHSLVQNMACDPSATTALQSNVQAIVQCIFGVVEDKVESLKTTALALLSRVLEIFSGVEDPEDPEDGALLMDVFAAPYVTALKTCLATSGASPIVTQAAMLSAKLLSSGMLQQDHHSCEVFPAPCLFAGLCWFV